MIRPVIQWIGDTRFAGKMSKRSASAEIESRVFKPWRSDILKKKIPAMYRAGGAVRGSQGKWAPLAPDTVAKKGSSSVLLAAGSAAWRFGAMVRSYVIEGKRRGLRAWEFTLSNRARSKPWRAASGDIVPGGFDYPSATHSGWAGYDVFPRPDNPHGTLRWRLAGGDWVIAKKTHPEGAPERPHLKIHPPWVEKLLRSSARWILTGRG
jgi:hypothetical protein